MTVELSAEVQAYHRQEALRFAALQGHRGVVLDMEVEAPVVGLVEHFDPKGDIGRAIGANITRLYDSVEAHEVTTEGNTYTIGVGVLPGTGDRVKLRNATHRSSLVGNHGNGFEVARDAFLDAEVTQVYIDAPGMGLTSPLTPAERKYVRRYGSLLDVDSSGDIRALPFVHALGKVLHGMGIEVTDIEDASAGALPGIAHGAVYGRGNILTAHQNVRPGVKDVGKLSMLYGMTRVDVNISEQHKRLTPDVLAASGKGAFADQYVHASEVFMGKGFTNHPSKAMQFTNLVGLGRGPRQGDPLVGDNIAFARTNPDAKILFTLGERDPLSAGPRLQRRLREIVGNVSAHSNASVSAVVFEGMSHNIYTHYPQYLRAVSRFLLDLSSHS